MALLGVVLVAPIAVSAEAVVAGVADAAKPPPQPQPAHHGHRRPTMDDRIKVLAQNLNLSEAQQTAVKKILEERQQETLQLRLDSSLSGEARIARFRALQVTTVEQIRAVLNEEQRNRYDPLAPRRLQPAPDQRSVQEWLKLTTPQ